jgi:hypothetical protein
MVMYLHRGTTGIVGAEEKNLFSPATEYIRYCGYIKQKKVIHAVLLADRW